MGAQRAAFFEGDAALRLPQPLLQLRRAKLVHAGTYSLLGTALGTARGALGTVLGTAVNYIGTVDLAFWSFNSQTQFNRP